MAKIQKGLIPLVAAYYVTATLIGLARLSLAWLPALSLAGLLVLLMVAYYVATTLAHYEPGARRGQLSCACSQRLRRLHHAGRRDAT
jgi:hypothetical protein